MFLIIDDYFRYLVVEIVKLILVVIVIFKLDKVFLEFGVLDVVKFDNGFFFNSKEFVLFVDDFGFKYWKVILKWVRVNGEVERFVCIVKKVIKIVKVECKNFK